MSARSSWSSGSWQPPPAPAIASYAEPTQAPDVTPVWVLLEEHLPHDPRQRRTVPDGLELTGRVRGFLRKPWYRCAGCGAWLGAVTFEVHYADGRARTEIYRDQLVHAGALLPRHDGRHL